VDTTCREDRHVKIVYKTNLNYNTHTHTTVLLLFWNMPGTTRVSRYQKGKTRKLKPIWIYWSKRQEWQWLYASLHLIPDNHDNIPKQT